jgi:hypothetical protein
MGNLVSVPAQVMGMNPKADRSWTIKFETRELSGEEVKILADAFQGEGWLLFKPNSDDAIEAGEIPKIDADAGIESPSVRLRKRMYVYWKQQNRKESFEAFYMTQMNKSIEFWESKLEPSERL